METGAKMNKEEMDFLNAFADSYVMSHSKKIYYYVLFYMKRNLPLFMIRFMIERKVSKTFQNNNAPMSFQELHKEFSEIIILTAMKQFSLAGTKSSKIFDDKFYSFSKSKLKKTEKSIEDSLSFRAYFEKYMARIKK